MRRACEAITLALVPRPIPQGDSMGRERRKIQAEKNGENAGQDMCCSTADRRSHNTTFIINARKNAPEAFYGVFSVLPVNLYAEEGKRLTARYRRFWQWVSGHSPDQTFWRAVTGVAVLQNTSGPVFGNPFPVRAATGRRFVERHTVAVQQNISCPGPGIGYRCPGVRCQGEGQKNDEKSRSRRRSKPVAEGAVGVGVNDALTGMKGDALKGRRARMVISPKPACGGEDPKGSTAPCPAKPGFKFHGTGRDEDADGRRRTGVTANPACRKAGATINGATRHRDFKGEPQSGDIRSTSRTAVIHSGAVKFLRIFF